jgi:DNA-binding MarR family transcriptional regulator
MTDIITRLRAEDAESGLRHSIATEAADRIEELEEELRQFKEDIAPTDNPFFGMFDLTRQQMSILYALYRSNVCTDKQLDRVTQVYGRDFRGEEEGAVCNRTKVAICKIRAKLRKTGVDIKNIWGFGYMIVEADKAKLTALLNNQDV